MRRTAAIAACVLCAFALINYLEFNYWFYNNEMPAYLRGGVIHGDAAPAIQAFYEAARDACPQWRPNAVADCRAYQVALLGHATYVRPISSAGGLLLTLLSTQIEFMQALKFAMIVLAVGGALLCGLLLLPFLCRLDTDALAAVGLVSAGGWFASRPLHVAGTNILLLTIAVVAIGLAVGYFRRHGLPSLVLKIPPERKSWSADMTAAKRVVQLLAIVCCFALGNLLHVRYASRFPLLYLLLTLGLWPLLHRALALSGNWMVTGLLSAVLYLSAVLMPSIFDLSLSKQHQIVLVGILLFVAIWRDDDRVFRALPLVLLFDMQNGARLAALVFVAECLVGLFRRRMPAAVVPAVLTAVIGVAVTATTAFHPFERLYSVSDAVGVLTTPVVLMAGFVALALVWSVLDRGPPKAASHPVALDRMLVYAASIVVMAGIQVPTMRLAFDAFQLSTLFRSVAIAPIMALSFAIVALLLTTCRTRATEPDKGSAFASIALLLLLFGTAQGRNVSLAQLSEGVRASFSSYLPADWSRRTPHLTLADDTVYYDVESLETGALMQYSLIKILLLSRNPDFSREKLTILPFGGRAR